MARKPAAPHEKPLEDTALNKQNTAPGETSDIEGPSAGSSTELIAGPIPIRKINPKDVMEKKMKDISVPADLFTLIGTAYNLRDGDSSFGPWTALVGEFEATRLVDGQRYISTQCFLPGAAGDLLIAQVRKFVTEEIPVSQEQYKKTGKTYKVTGETVEMALIVSIKAATREGGAQYEYVVRPVVPVQKADPLAALRERMVKSLPLLVKSAPALPPPSA